MCGGIVWNLEKMPKKELTKFYSQEQIEKFIKAGQATSFYWDNQPTLPIKIDGGLKLAKWGNRDNQENKLPHTGWAKIESIENGQWNWLHPQEVIIPAKRGYEKGIWFDIKSGGIKGIITKKDNEEVVYMITQKADSDYLKMTKHDRQPIEIDK